MVSAFWEMFKPFYAVEMLEGYTEKETEYLKELFGALPQVPEDYYRAAGQTKAFHCVQDTWLYIPPGHAQSRRQIAAVQESTHPAGDDPTSDVEETKRRKSVLL